jgi:heme/copper-type cytochrome/quinol oxidase subunit 1
MIIPAFGIISHAITAFSGKSVFGLNGPCNVQQTICKKMFLIILLIKLNNFINEFVKWIKLLYFKLYLQVTKARLDISYFIFI